MKSDEFIIPAGRCELCPRRCAAERFGGGGVHNEGAIRSHHVGFLDMEHSARITVPPMSCVYFRYKPRKDHKHNK